MPEHKPVRNSVARAAILRKGGVHEKSPSAERAVQRKNLRAEVERALNRRARTEHN